MIRRYSAIQGMFGQDYRQMLSDLMHIKKNYGRTDEVDVRLCVDYKEGQPSWIVRFGSSDYDQRHSMYCGASSMQRDSNCKSILEDLINQVNDQVSDNDDDHERRHEL